MTEIDKHPEIDGCYFCATGSELAVWLCGDERGRLLRVLHMNLPVESCPNVDPSDFTPPVLPSGGQS